MALVTSCDFAGTQATRANAHLLHSAVHDHVYGLHIRRPAALRLAVGMTDRIAGHDSLIADFTVLTHSAHLLAKNRTVLYYHSYRAIASTFFDYFNPKN